MALSLTGCSSFPRDKSSGPDAAKPVGGKAINLLQLRDNVKSTRVALNRTTDALNRIPSAPNAQEAYAAFSTELSVFKKLAENTLRDSADVRNSGKVLFAEWEQEAATIKNADIRAIAEKRRSTLQAGYNAMVTPLLAARADLTEIRNDLTDIQKVLALDPTPAGIAAVKKPIEQINSKAVATVTSLDALAANLDKIAADLPPPAVAPVK
ncbi:MAG: DUF2959 family protein [Opitutaceae bacterium]|nr:DUF2959 family protein [Opitutaceae bacterium]